MNSSVEHLETHEGLVEGDFVACLEDADETKFSCGLDLSVGDAVCGGDVGEAGGAIIVGAGVGEGFAERFAAEPVAEMDC